MGEHARQKSGPERSRIGTSGMISGTVAEESAQMRRMILLAGGLFALLNLQACATPRIELVSGLVATGGDPKFEEVPVSSVPLKDTVNVLTHLRWSPATDEGGRHEVQWLWYSGDQLVHTRKRTLHFRKTPYRLHSSLPATGLGLGHYRVTVLIDGAIVDTQQFDVVP
jgi:hypothetical protein